MSLHKRYLIKEHLVVHPCCFDTILKQFAPSWGEVQVLSILGCSVKIRVYLYFPYSHKTQCDPFLLFVPSCLHVVAWRFQRTWIILLTEIVRKNLFRTFINFLKVRLVFHRKYQSDINTCTSTTNAKTSKNMSTPK